MRQNDITATSSSSSPLNFQPDLDQMLGGPITLSIALGYLSAVLSGAKQGNVYSNCSSGNRGGTSLPNFLLQISLRYRESNNGATCACARGVCPPNQNYFHTPLNYTCVGGSIVYIIYTCSYCRISWCLNIMCVCVCVCVCVCL